MQERAKFIVRCERIKKQSRYKLSFRINETMIARIKNLPSEQRKYNTNDFTWELTTKGLYNIIKIYKGSNKLLFDFGVYRDIFYEQIKKIDADEAEKKRIIIELEKNKIIWNEYKAALELDHSHKIEEVHRNLKEGVKLFPFQVVSAVFLNEVRNALLSLEMGLGKAQDLDSKLLTPNGWIRMGDVKIGENIIGSDGKITKILNIFPQGKKDIYEIVFNDGTTARSCGEHLWNVNTTTRNFRNKPYETKSLNEIINNGLQFKNGNNKYYIPIVKPIQFENKNLLINPYVLGCLLGDGSITQKSNIGFTSIDEEIINNIQIKLPKKHNLVKIKNYDIGYYLTADGKNNYINQSLKKYKLKGTSSYTKFIPDDYLYSSIEQRLELLRGILDTDGHSRKDGIVELTLASKNLIDGVQFIVQSLGGIGRLKDKWVLYKGEKRKYYRLNIKLPPQYIPFKLKRKIETFVPPTKYLPNRAIVKINYIGKKEAQCILVDAKDHLYVTDNCILTHNTISTIAYIEMNDFNKVFVITPNSLKHNFFHEVEKFTHSKAHILNWKKNKYSFEESKYIIVNYEYFNPKSSKKMDKKFNELELGKIDSLVCDESHRLKNTKSNTYKNFKRIFKKDMFVDKKMSKIFLSGTPAPNRAHELYTILNQISPIEFPTKKDFFEIYCGMNYDPEVEGGWTTSFSAMNLEELYNKVTPYTYRKRKKDVLKDLPDKIYQRLILDLTPEEETLYNEIEEGIANEIVNETNTNPLTIMIRLRQFTSSLKIKHIKEVVDRLLDEGQKIVIVDMFKDILYDLHELYPNISAVHTGDQTVEERSAIVEDFQNPNGKAQIFLGSIQTCNYGLTLTAASRLFIITLPYSVGEYDQVSDRLHRIGQKDTVNIYPLIFSDTIDDYVFKIIESKRKEINKVIDNEDYESNVDESVIGELIKVLKEKYGK